MRSNLLAMCSDGYPPTDLKILLSPIVFLDWSWFSLEADLTDGSIEELFLCAEMYSLGSSDWVISVILVAVSYWRADDCKATLDFLEMPWTSPRFSFNWFFLVIKLFDLVLSFALSYS